MCHELAVLFRDKVIPLSRRIIEEGSFEERKAHLAHVIAEFLEAGILPLHGLQSLQETDASDGEGAFSEQADEESGEISDREVEEFVTLELKSLDDPVYFKKHFG